jgi:hypothetical protein
VNLALRYLFLDESGNLDFSIKGSRYFTVTSIVLDDCEIGNDLIDLRRKLAREDVDIFGQFHATEDQQVIRNRVFEVIHEYDFRIGVTVLQKAKAHEHLRTDREAFYRLAVYFHLRHLIPRIAESGDELLIVCAALGTHKQMAAHLGNLRNVARESVPAEAIVRAALWSASSEPCLQVADYCCWAVHRKWEREDQRSYDLIASRIRSEFDLFSRG